MTTVDCIRGEHVSGADIYPIFIGFMRAVDLNRFAEAPAFKLNTDHEVIAGNISTSPVREWQRPLDKERVDEITRVFKDSREIMPNAVLLAAPNPALVHLTSHGGTSWQLQVTASTQKPLWILDGQHRIAGLRGSRPDDEIPFVLLASHGTSAKYQDSTFARIFAQVTTTAEGLHPLHHEWLTFAFELGKYDVTSPPTALRSSQEVEAMEFAVGLCHERYVDAGKSVANPFFNRVAFNPRTVNRREPSPSVGPDSGGFQIDAAAYQKLAVRSYYAAALPAGKIDPRALAREVGKAYNALVECHPAAHRSESVLLNPAGAAKAKGHKALQEGVLHGILRHVAENGIPADWRDVMEKRAIHTTDWRASAWSSASRSGTQGTVNRKLARRTFETLFARTLSDLFLPGSAPPSKVDLRNYFSGDVGWGLEVQGRRIGKKGRKLQFAGGTDPVARLEAGTMLEQVQIGALRMLAVGRTTPNLVAITASDTARPYDRDWNYPSLKTGLPLSMSPHLHSNPVKVRFDFTFYGGRSRYVELEVHWT